MRFRNASHILPVHCENIEEIEQTPIPIGPLLYLAQNEQQYVALLS